MILNGLLVESKTSPVIFMQPLDHPVTGFER